MLFCVVERVLSSFFDTIFFAFSKSFKKLKQDCEGISAMLQLTIYLCFTLPPVYIISSPPRNVSRLQARFNATLWPGVLLQNKSLPVHLKKFEGPKTSKLSKGAIGCALAHLTLLQHFFRYKGTGNNCI